MAAQTLKRNVIFTIIASFMMFFLFSCNPSANKNITGPTENNKVVPVQAVNKPCAGGINQPVRRLVYAWTEGVDVFFRDPDPNGDQSYNGKLLLDTEKPNQNTTDLMAKASQDYALTIDNYFTNLSRQGLGAWDGCYGSESTQRIMTTRIHYPGTPKFLCGFQPGTTFAEVLLADDCFTPTAIAHEWTHALTMRTLGLPETNDTPSKQSDAISESISDIFGIVIGDIDNEYAIKLQSNVRRSLADPAKYGQVFKMADFSPSNDKYKNAGIFSMAAYLLMEDSKIITTVLKVQPIGKEKVGRIFFHSLSPTFVQHLSTDKNVIQGDFTFEEMAKGVIAACQNLANPNQEKIVPADRPGKAGITPYDCEQVKLAFQAVGILSITAATETTITPQPTSPISSKKTAIVPTITTQSSLPGHLIYSTTDKNGISSIRMSDLDGTNEKTILSSPLRIELMPYLDLAENHITYKTYDQTNRLDVLNLSTMDGLSKVVFSVQTTSMYSRLSPDGKYIYIKYYPLINNNYSCFESLVVKTESLETTKITSGAGTIIWSPDNQRIAFLTTETDKPCSGKPLAKGLYVINKDGSDLKKLETNDLRNLKILAWSKDNQKIYFTDYNDNTNNQRYLYSIHSDGSNLRKIYTIGNIDSVISLSPDENWLLYSVRDGKSNELSIRNLDGSDPQQLLKGNFNVYFSQWSSDSKFILYCGVAHGDNSFSCSDGFFYIINIADRKIVKGAKVASPDRTYWIP